MNHRRASESKDAVHAEDLSALERRGRLAAAERRRLEMALAASDALRCSHQLGGDFDALATACDGDAALVARIARRARARYARPSMLRPQSRVARALPWLGVATLLLVSAAAGARLWSYALTRTVSTPAVVPSLAGSAATKQRRPTPARAQAPAEMKDQSAASPVTTPPRPNQQSTSGESDAKSRELGTVTRPPNLAVAASTATPLPAEHAETASVARLPQTAAALFSDANAARRRGDIEGARALYERLRESYPAANETALSYVLMARVDLKNGLARTALHQFEQYLALAPTGPLAEEALEGRAAAYRQLNRPTEEARDWRELLHLYPNSIYAPAASKRLEELR